MRNIDPTFGDLRALREQMMRWAMRLTGARHRADDLVQSTLLRMLSRRHLFDASKGGVEPWARIVMVNVWKQERRVDARMPMVDFDTVLAAAPDNPFTATYCRQVCAMLGLDSVMLLAAPPDRMTATQRSRRFRARRELRAAA